MQDLRARAACLLVLLPVFAGLNACSGDASKTRAAIPVVAGLGDPALDARSRGLVLIAELGCTNCHGATVGTPDPDARQGPDLTEVGRRIRPGYLQRFLADPLGVHPGTTMPDMLRQRTAAERGPIAASLAAYLRSVGVPTTAAEAQTLARDEAAAQRGGELFHTIGCAACHGPRGERGEPTGAAGDVPLVDLSAKYRASGLQAFLLAPRASRPSARMPDLHLTPSEAHELTQFLLAAPPTPEAPAASTAAPEEIAAGRRWFVDLQCAACHRIDDPALPKPGDAPQVRARGLSQLVAAQGCGSASPGPGAFYMLSDAQRADLTAAMRTPDAPSNDEARIRQLLASRNCTACHQRGTFGGPTADRMQFFTTNDEGLGLNGRVPPTLSDVGAKLQGEWLTGVIAHGAAPSGAVANARSVRPYLRTRMPGFDDALATELATLFARTDTLPPVAVTPLPDDNAAERAIIDLGRELVGEKGMACITCHVFAGDRVGTMGAPDLVDSTAQRLRPEWFRHFLEAPTRFQPFTLMPRFFVDGVSTRPQLGDGDVAHQIDAIWHYLGKGRNVRKPDGMRQPPIELVVGDEAVVLRRSVQNTGKRGISVGYPHGVNLTFDAETLALDQIWWGRFVDAAPVWTGQGSGQARILGKERISLPKGPAFAELADASAPWPTATRRELGQQFLGYELDAQQRPSFRYRCADVTITDTPHEIGVESPVADQDPPRPMLRRTIVFDGPSDRTLYFRAALDARIDDGGDGTVRVGSSLRMRLANPAIQVRATGDQRELIVAIPIRGGHAEQIIDYEWLEEGK